MKKVTKAVIPAAGLCTRFLPASKSVHKCMFPLGDKPIIQIIVEDLVKAGITDIVIVTGHHSESIINHFAPAPKSMLQLLERGGEKRKPILEAVEKISSLANFYFATQKGRIGNFSPLNDIKNILGDEPFIHTWADDMFYVSTGPNEYEQMISVYEKYDSTVLPCTNVVDERGFNSYGMVGGDLNSDGDLLVKTMVEKPGKANSPSSLGAVSSQLYKPEVLSYMQDVLNSLPDDKEFGYYDVICNMISCGCRVVAFNVKNSVYLDMGDNLSYLQAQILFALKSKVSPSQINSFLGIH